MLQNLQKHIAENLSFLNNKKLLVAVSGGIDSVVLTHLLHELKFDISLAHCNFQLRAQDSDLDEQFVKGLAQKLDVQVFTTSFETEKYAKENKVSIQMAARELRYHWFEELRTENHYDYILTAHQKDDVLETFLINFTRGTGLDGLTGIPEINGNIVRPLLSFTRDEIEQYAKNKGIPWREDQSNLSTKYFRNKIRHQVVPILKELNPQFLTSFQNTLSHLKDSQEIISDSIKNISTKIELQNQSENEVKKFSVKKLRELSNPKAYLYELLKNYGFTEWNDLVELLKGQSGKQIFSKTHRLLKNREELILSTITDTTSNHKAQITEFQTELSYPIKLKIENVTNVTFESKNVTYIDKILLKFPLTVRKWQKGDYFYPLGMKGKKKLSKYFKDEKYSLLDKENSWLLCNENEIVWVIGMRLDDRYKITDKTKEILKITYTTHETPN